MHVTVEQIEKLQRQSLTPRETLEVARHLSQCVDCARVATSLQQPGRWPALISAIVEGEHPALETLEACAWNGLRDEAVEDHLDACQQCRSDIDELRRLQEPARSRRLIFVAALSAAAAAAIIWILVPYWEPSASRTDRGIVVSRSITTKASHYGRNDWDLLVKKAMDAGAVEAPVILRELRPSSHALRGNVQPERVSLHPVGVVVEETTPNFTWTPFEHAHYTVSVFEAEREIATGDDLTSPSWSPQRELRRGVTYTWQVEVHRGTTLVTIPAPPQPPARFRILDDAGVKELDDARLRFPNDHILLGVLAARYGLQEQAERQFRLASTSAGDRLASSVAAWSSIDGPQNL